MGTQKGAAILELVIVLPFLLMLAIGIIEFSNVLMTFNTVNKLTMDASRYLSIYAKQGGTYSISSTLATNAQNLINCQKLTSCGKCDDKPMPFFTLECQTPLQAAPPVPPANIVPSIVVTDGTIKDGVKLIVTYQYAPIFTFIPMFFYGQPIYPNYTLASTITVQAL